MREVTTQGDDMDEAMAVAADAVAVALSTPGQHGHLTFDGTAGRRVSVVTTNGTLAWSESATE